MAILIIVDVDVRLIRLLITSGFILLISLIGFIFLGLIEALLLELVAQIINSSSQSPDSGTVIITFCFIVVNNSIESSYLSNDAFSVDFLLLEVNKSFEIIFQPPNVLGVNLSHYTVSFFYEHFFHIEGFIDVHSSHVLPSVPQDQGNRVAEAEYLVFNLFIISQPVSRLKSFLDMVQELGDNIQVVN